MRTFYISSSSHPSNLPRVERLVKLLRGLGLSWYNGFDWTVGLQEESRYSEEELTLRCEADIQGAAHADLFVFLDSQYHSRGGCMEYGIRLYTGYVHHVACSDRKYLFYRNYRVRHHDDVESLLLWLQDRRS
jgi:hypothetical protein